MELMRVYGPPTLFITMTANPEWKEVQENLRFGQKAQDRPDLMARVFLQKMVACKFQKLNSILKDDLIETVTKKDLFGKVLCYSYSIESQQRGNLHVRRPNINSDFQMHLLVTLQEKLQTPEAVNRVISAELPGEEVNKN